MRRRRNECTPPSPTGGSAGGPSDDDSSRPPCGLRDNAFRPELFEELCRREPSPPVPEGGFSGPWRVTRLWGDGPPLWACYGAGERAPRLTFEEPDLAYLAAAALAIAERRMRFRFQTGADGREHLMHDGVPVANVNSDVMTGSSLPADLTRLADLRAQPMALAQFLLSVPDEVLERTGAIFLDELRRSRQEVER
jgi:hypothetical protein